MQNRVQTNEGYRTGQKEARHVLQIHQPWKINHCHNKPYWVITKIQGTTLKTMLFRTHFRHVQLLCQISAFLLGLQSLV